MGQITRLKDNGGGSIYPLTTADAVYVGNTNLSTKLNNLTKSDVGLGNVLNQAITVTSSSVSNGTTTFNKYTHPTTEGNKHIPAGGSTGQFLKYSAAGTASWSSITKSDVGLGNVSNQTITVTSSSVTDGTNTFSKYTHPTSAGNKHIPTGGSNGQYLKYSASGTATWADIPTYSTVTGQANGLVPAPSGKLGVSSIQATSAYYIYATSAAGTTPGWYKLPDSAFYSAVTGSADGIVIAPAAANLVSTEATSAYYIYATAGSGQNPHWYRLPSTAFTTLTNDYYNSSNTSTTALSALGAYNMYNEIQATLGEISSLLDSI